MYKLLSGTFFRCFLALTVVLIASCSNYDKLLKSDDTNLKYEEAKKYYNKGQYSKALPLFQQLITFYKGTELENDLRYYVAYSHYGQGSFLLAAALFKNYYTFFPGTEKAEECQFMSALCYYKALPKPDLDQTVSLKATEAFQLFINNYPKSERVEEANNYIDQMRRRLETKALASAELYFKTRNYLAAAIAYENLLINFPDIPQDAQVSFRIIKSYSLLADNSVICKKEERYDKAIQAYVRFADRYQESHLMEEATTIRNKAAEERVKAAEGCVEFERIQAFTKAELAFRNKELDKAIRFYQDYLRSYPEADNRELVHIGIISAWKKKGDDAETDCEKHEAYEAGLKAYYTYIDKFASGAEVREAEKQYLRLNEANEPVKNACNNELN